MSTAGARTRCARARGDVGGCSQEAWRVHGRGIYIAGWRGKRGSRRGSGHWTGQRRGAGDGRFRQRNQHQRCDVPWETEHH